MTLKPCPFCGNKKLKPFAMWSNGQIRKAIIIGYTVTCEPDELACGGHGPIANNKKLAIAQWNRRAK